VNAADIPSQTLAEVYQAIAERRGANLTALDKQNVNEAEFMAALAYVLGTPLIETEDLTEALLSDCRAVAAELETDALRDYQIAPLARRGDALIAISSCPYDPIIAEVLLGYFRPCSQVKFVLASPACLRELLNRLKLAEQKEIVSVGYVPKSSPAKTAVPLRGHSDATPIVMPPGAKSADLPKAIAPLAPSRVSSDPSVEDPQQANQPLLTSEDVTRLMNVLAGEIHRLAQQKS
jgi:hypothetical protein